MDPTPDRFRALARSSPWRWRTLQLTARWAGPGAHDPIRAWIRRPARLRVERLDGSVVATDQVVAPAAAASGRATPPVAELGGREPVWTAERLVAARPVLAGSGDPMFRDYQWVAMLDPVELADGEPGHPGSPVTIDGLVAVTHHGRDAWEASLRPTGGYLPRCSCCALLFSATGERHQAAGTRAADADPRLRYPDAHRVRLDVATGVCVLVEQLGGTRAGTRAEFAIEASGA